MTEGKVSPDLGVGWLELGMLSLVEGKREETLRHFARARQLAPQNPRMPLQTAKALSQLKRPDEAIQQVREAVRLDPDFWEARSFLGEGLASVVASAKLKGDSKRYCASRPITRERIRTWVWPCSGKAAAAKHY